MDKNRDKGTFFSSKRIFEFNGKTMDFTVPRVMGILNLTPDSFYDNRGQGGMEAGRHGSGEAWKVEKMIQDGGYIIDIGAVSTRPGAAEVPQEEEKRRLLPVVRSIRKEYPDIIISIDTFRSEIAKLAAGEGADMINDISGGMIDPLMHSCIIKLGIPYVIMHMQGTPADMQLNPVYEDVKREVHGFLLGQAKKLEEKGHGKIILDPGFGFGKTVEHNFTLLETLDELCGLGYPVLAGLSRKSMINRVLGTKPDQALNGTTVLNTVALLKGASILRVHDVKEAAQAVKLTAVIGSL
jgi:dihydropteroate synthase